MKKLLLEPYKDMFNIYNMIKKINKDYSLFFDKKNKDFLIINTKNHYEICYRFKNFSSNILLTLQKTKVENSSQLFDFIELENKKLTEKYQKEKLDKLSLKVKELKKYSSRTNKILQSDIDKINEVENA
ncbi:MAG: hypothetical protein IJX17_00775 [Clostridia bacterium]|nr:hypothetical protein [Clostridia bacterium]